MFSCSAHTAPTLACIADGIETLPRWAFPLGSPYFGLIFWSPFLVSRALYLRLLGLLILVSLFSSPFLVSLFWSLYSNLLPYGGLLVLVFLILVSLFWSSWVLIQVSLSSLPRWFFILVHWTRMKSHLGQCPTILFSRFPSQTFPFLSCCLPFCSTIFNSPFSYPYKS